MPFAYPPGQTTLEPATLDDEVLLHIGRLVRAFAEIEDIVTLYMFRLAMTPEGSGLVMLGRTPLSTRLKRAEYLAKMRGAEATALHRRTFNASFYESVKCRNVVAHGTLIGKSVEMGWAFLTVDTVEPDTPEDPDSGGKASHIVISYPTASIAEHATVAQSHVNPMADALGVRDRREGRRKRPLDAHPKGHPRQ